MIKNILLLNFITSLFLGLCIYTAQKLTIQLPFFINNYVNDFLIIPIVLFICLLVLRWLRNDKYFIIPIFSIIYISVFFTVFFELIMPKLSERYTTDIFDSIMYGLGSFWFWFLQKKSQYSS